MLPIENEQPTEEQSSEVREMRHIVRCQSGHRTKSSKKLDERIYNNEHARTYGYRDEEDEHWNIRIQPSEGEEDAEDSA